MSIGPSNSGMPLRSVAQPRTSRAGLDPWRGDMATTRKQDLQHMAATLKAWAGQIADLQAKARSAGAERNW